MQRVKKNYKLILKKCLILSAFACSVAAQAAIDPTKSMGHTIDAYLQSDLATFREEKLTDFKSLIEKWERVYGEAATPALARIAKDIKAKDSDRYVAILATTKILGPKSAVETTALLENKNWMVRSAALKSIEILGYTPAGPKVLDHLAKDPALVIRLQAIETLLRIRPEGLEKALLAATMNGQNYRPADFQKGRADWIPQRALEAIRELAPELVRAKKSHTIALELLPLLNKSKDGRVRAQALNTIETLEEKSLRSGRPFSERAVAWNRALGARD